MSLTQQERETHSQQAFWQQNSEERALKNAEESGISSLLAAFVSSVAEKDCLAKKNLSDFLRMGIFNHETGDRMDEREKKDFRN